MMMINDIIADDDPGTGPTGVLILMLMIIININSDDDPGT